MGPTRLTRIAVLILLGACGGSGGTGLARSEVPLVPNERDSAGVRLLEYSADALERAPLIAIDTTTLATIGKGDPDLDLSRAYSAVVLRDGGIAFFTNGTVHLYSPDGATHQRIGREGAGPGEFRDGELAWGRGDTILVTDGSNSRIVWIVPAKGVVRTRALQLSRPGMGFGAIAQFADDTLIMGTTSYFPQFAETGTRVQMPVGLLTGASDSIRVLVPLEGGEMRSVPALARFGMGSEAAVRYSPMPQTGGWGDGFLAVRPDHWHLDRYSPAGGLTLSVRIPLRRVPFTKELRDRDIAGTIARMKEGPSAPPDTSSAYKMYYDLPYPDSLPSFGNVVTTPGGIAWVRDQRLASDTTWAFTAVAVDGKILGRLIGTGRPPFTLGGDRVVLREEDADGVVTWRLMGLKWVNVKH